jgi:ribosome recycling factor
LSSSGETREKLIRDVRTITEEGKIALRRVRQEIRDLIKKNSSFSQDQKRNYEIQTDRIIKDYQDKLTTAEGKKIQELGKV